jgi:hypothetical protein
MAENNREINIDPIELNLDELLALEPDEVEVNPVEEFTLNPEGKSSDATDSSSVATDSNSDARAAKERLEENINWWQSGGAINLNDMTLMASKGKGFKQTDKDILDFVVRNFPGGFDLKGARKAGFSDTQILSKLTGSSSAGRTKAFAESTTRGALETGPIVAGAVTGWNAGLLFGPGAWIASPILALGGALYGGYAGKKASDTLVPREGGYSPSSRPFGESGFTLGAGVSTLWAGPAAVGRGRPAFLENSVLDQIAKLNGRNEAVLGQSQFLRNSLRDFAKDNPTLAFSTESSSIAGSSLGAYLAENTSPGDTLFRISSEVGFGLAHPAALLQTAYRKLAGSTGLFAVFSKEGRQKRGVKAVLDFLGRDNTDQILKDLNNPTKLQELADALDIKQAQFGPVPLDRRASVITEKFTTSQLIDNERLATLQNTLATNPAYSSKMKEAMREGQNALANLIYLFKQSGDPILVNQAYLMKKETVKRRIIESLDNINVEVIRLNSKIAPDDPAQAMKSGRVMESATRNTLLNLRKQESNFYDLVDQSDLMSAENFVQMIEEDELSLSFLPPIGKKAYYNSKLDLNEEQVTEVTRLIERENKKIDKAEEVISSIEAKYPGYNEEVKVLLDDAGTPEEKLQRLQYVLENFEDYAVNYNGADKTRLKRVLENTAVMQDANINKLDLQASLKSPPEDFVNEVTLKDLMDTRSKLLAKVRSLKADKAFDEANTVSNLITAIDKDIGAKAYSNNLEYSELTENQKLLRDAYDFSKEFNDVITRAFPQEVLNVNKTGSTQLVPELLINRLFSGGGDPLSLRYQDLNKAVSLIKDDLTVDLNTKTPVTLSETLGTMSGAQEDLLRVAFEKIIDNQTGRISPTKLANFKTEYRNVFYDEQGIARFPDLIKDLETAKTAQRLLDTRVSKVGYPGSPLKTLKVNGKDYVVGNFPKNSILEKKLKNKINFFEALNDGKTTNENAYIANKFVSAFLPDPGSRLNANTNSTENFKGLIIATKKMNAKYPGASEGLLDIILERAYQFGKKVDSSGNNVLDISAIKNYLFSPLDGGKGLSPVALMKKEGLIDAGFFYRLDRILNDGTRFQAQLARAGQGNTGENLPMPLVEKGIFRILSLRLGKAVEKRIPGTGQGLAEPGIFANLTGIEQKFVEVPNILSGDLLFQIVKDPKFFKEVMSKAANQPRLKIMQIDRVHNYLINAGFLGVRSDQVEEMPEEQFPLEYDVPGITSPVVQRERSPVVQTVSARSPVAPTDGATSAPEPRPFIVAQMPTAQQPPAPQARLSDRSGVASLLPAGGAQSNASSQERYAAAYPYDSISDLIRMRGTA